MFFPRTMIFIQSYFFFPQAVFCISDFILARFQLIHFTCEMIWLILLILLVSQHNLHFITFDPDMSIITYRKNMLFNWKRSK